MRVLVGCEESQSVCKAFFDAGHDAWSCDLQPSSGELPERHLQDDIFSVVDDGWDMAIFHPPCTFLCNSGVSHLGKNYYRWQQLADATDFFNRLSRSNIEKIAIENPIPHKYALALLDNDYNQLIQPYNFGHTERKATCLWLKNLPPLMSTMDAGLVMSKLPKKEQQRMHYLSPGPERAKLRSKTYDGISKAMAQQWG